MTSDTMANPRVTMDRSDCGGKQAGRWVIERRVLMRWDEWKSGRWLTPHHGNRGTVVAPTQRLFAVSPLVLGVVLVTGIGSRPLSAQSALQRSNASVVEKCRSAMLRATEAFREVAARHGGYGYYVSPDGMQRWGEGSITQDQVVVQPPGTPTCWRSLATSLSSDRGRVVLASDDRGGGGTRYTANFSRAVGDKRLISIQKAPTRDRIVWEMEIAKDGMVSSLDDDQTTAALRFLIRVDEASQFQVPRVHEAVQVGLQALLRSQMAGGGFPQVWDDSPGVNVGPLKARFPSQPARTAERIKEYWHLPTLNDAVALNVAKTLSLGASGLWRCGHTGSDGTTGQVSHTRSTARTAIRLGAAIRHPNASNVGT